MDIAVDAEGSVWMLYVRNGRVRLRKNPQAGGGGSADVDLVEHFVNAGKVPVPGITNVLSPPVQQVSCHIAPNGRLVVMAMDQQALYYGELEDLDVKGFSWHLL